MIYMCTNCDEPLPDCYCGEDDMLGWLDPPPKQDPPPMGLEDVRERLYDLVTAGRTSGDEARSLLATYKKLTGQDKPRFWS